MSNKTQPARGMRDFLPSDVRKREYVIKIIKEVYESYGFEPLETPAVENLETLTGKYGEEGGQLMFKILKRGEKLQEELESGKIKSESQLSDLALRYDLTVPLARVVANYKNELPKFFKRYQIQPVWRADRPARGRYREFYQCDVDAIGSSSMMVEAELISAVCKILDELEFKDYLVKLNHREVLRGMLEVCGIDKEKHSDALIVLDKLDKVGRDVVLKELDERNVFTTKSAEKFFTKFVDLVMIFIKKSEERPESQITGFTLEEVNELNKSIFESLDEFIDKNESGNQGLSELKKICDLIKNSVAERNIMIDPTLARGLSYYTGAIFEIVLNDGDFAGSIGGGGRYDGLIGMFGKEQIPACGFSLGLERILVVMEERGMFPPELQSASADVLVTVWNEETAGESLKLANELRQTGIRVLVYPEADKLGKQFKYASQINIPFVCILGENELAENKVALKNMQTGEQETLSREEIVEKIKI